MEKQTVKDCFVVVVVLIVTSYYKGFVVCVLIAVESLLDILVWFLYVDSSRSNIVGDTRDYINM